MAVCIWLTLHHLEKKKKNSYQQWPIFALVYFHMLMCTSYPNYFLKFFPPNYIPHMENALY